MAITANSIELQWDASTDNVAVSHYLIFKKEGGVWDGGLNVGNVTNYVYAGLTPDTEYDFQHQAVDTAPPPGPNYSPKGNIVTASTLAGGFDTDYQLYLDRLTTLGRTLPSQGQQTHQNQLVIDIKASGAWNKADAISLFATDSGADSSRVNLYPPSSFENFISGPVTFVSDVGFNGNGFTGHLTLAMNLSSDTTNFTLDDNCAVGYFLDGSDNTTYIFGSLVLAPTVFGYHLGDSLANRINTTSSGATTDLTDNFLGLRRESSTVISVINGTPLDTSLTSASIPDLQFDWVGRNGSDSTLPVKPISFGYIGASLTDTELVNLKISIEDYLIAIGSLLSSTQVDQFLIDADNGGAYSSGDTIDLTSRSQPRTNVSDISVNNLVALGVTVITS